MKLNIEIYIYHNAKIYKVVNYENVRTFSQVNNSFEIEYNTGKTENYPNSEYDFVMMGIN